MIGKTARELVSEFKVTTRDVNATCERMFESKLIKLVKKLPRSHVLILKCVERWYEMKLRDTKKLIEAEILKIYNREIVDEFGVEKITVNTVFELCTYLSECNIL